MARSDHIPEYQFQAVMARRGLKGGKRGKPHGTAPTSSTPAANFALPRK